MGELWEPGNLRWGQFLIELELMKKIDANWQTSNFTYNGHRVGHKIVLVSHWVPLVRTEKGLQGKSIIF